MICYTCLKTQIMSVHGKLLDEKLLYQFQWMNTLWWFMCTIKNALYHFREVKLHYDFHEPLLWGMFALDVSNKQFSTYLSMVKLYFMSESNWSVVKIKLDFIQVHSAVYLFSFFPFSFEKFTVKFNFSLQFHEIYYCFGCISDLKWILCE